MTVGTILQLFSFLIYVAAFVPPEGESGPGLDVRLVGIALLIAPVVFVSVGWISGRDGALSRALQATGLLIVLGLVIGLLSPVVGAAAGFGVGHALTLEMPAFDGQLRRRLVAVGLVAAYTFVILGLIPPAGLLAGALLPGFIVGFADEYGAWRESRLGNDPGFLG